MNLNLFQIQFQLIFYNILAIPSTLRGCEDRTQKQSDISYKQRRIRQTGYNLLEHRKKN